MNKLVKHPRIEIYGGQASFRCQYTGQLVTHRIGLPSFIVLKKPSESAASEIYGSFASWNVLYRWLQDMKDNNEIPPEKYRHCIEWISDTLGVKTFPKLKPAPVNGIKSTSSKQPEDYVEMREPNFGSAAEEYALQQRLKEEKEESNGNAFDLRVRLLSKGINPIRAYTVITCPELRAVHAEEMDIEPCLGLEWIKTKTGIEFQPDAVQLTEYDVFSHAPAKWNQKQEAFIKRYLAKKATDKTKKSKTVKTTKKKEKVPIIVPSSIPMDETTQFAIDQ